MKVIEKFKEATAPYYDNAGPWTLEIETESGIKKSISFNEGEPEDMSFGRDLSDVFNISDLVKAAYEAGKAGEEYHFEYILEKDDE